MEENDKIDLSKRKFSSRLIVKNAIKRGWKIVGFESTPALFLVYIPGKDRPVKIFSASPMGNSYPASIFAKDKFATNKLLAENHIPVPDEILISETIDDKQIEEFISKHQKIVVKPLDASHGHGITMNVANIETATKALENARAQSSSNKVLFQQQLDGHDIRIVCIDFKPVDAISRIPASVIGDGHSTIDELIAITNSSDERGENYSAKLNIISKTAAQDFLGPDGMSDIPSQGKVVQVIGMSNVGLGGTIENGLLAKLPEFIINMAEEVARVMDLPVCGIDIMVRHKPNKDDTEETLQPLVIEVNQCPMLTMYPDEDSAGQQAVIDAYLDFIAK